VDELEAKARKLLAACPKCGGQPFASAPDIGRVMCCQPYAAPTKAHVAAVAEALRSARAEGKREGLEEAAALFAKHRHLAVREAAERIRALKDSPPLYIYATECDWACAHDARDALNQWCLAIGETADGYDPEDWERVPDDKELSFWCDPDGKIGEHGAPNSLVKKPAREWAELHGRGYLGSTEY
jgi:hypothetical protein